MGRMQSFGYFGYFGYFGKVKTPGSLDKAGSWLN
jgi:hypothetical protein